MAASRGRELPEDAEKAMTRLWVVTPGEEDGLLYAGGDPASSSRAETAARPGRSTRRSGSSPRGPTGALGQAACACTRSRPGQEIRRASHSRSRRWGSGFRTTVASWRRGNKGLYPRYMPEEARTDTLDLCVHNMHRAPSQPERLFMQFHGGVYRSDDAGETWESIADGLPSWTVFLDGARPGGPRQRVRHSLVADPDRRRLRGRCGSTRRVMPGRRSSAATAFRPTTRT